jgi:hypothetical protein
VLSRSKLDSESALPARKGVGALERILPGRERHDTGAGAENGTVTTQPSSSALPIACRVFGAIRHAWRDTDGAPSTNSRTSAESKSYEALEFWAGSEAMDRAYFDSIVLSYNHHGVSHVTLLRPHCVLDVRCQMFHLRHSKAPLSTGSPPE